MERLTGYGDRTMLGTIFLVVALTLAVQATAAEKHAASDTTGVGRKAEPQELPPPPTRTGKERLGRKWNDEQRTDNCNVPLELRGPKTRPNDCATSDNTRSKH
jgi:hypothetical protein